MWPPPESRETLVWGGCVEWTDSERVLEGSNYKEFNLGIVKMYGV